MSLLQGDILSIAAVSPFSVRERWGIVCGNNDY